MLLSVKRKNFVFDRLFSLALVQRSVVYKITKIFNYFEDFKTYRIF